MRRIGTGLALFAALSIAQAGKAAPQDFDQSRYDQLIVASKSSMMQDPAKALVLARAAATAGGSGRARPLDVARGQWLQGEALSRLDRYKDALAVLEVALDRVTRVAPADKLHGDILLSRGWAKEAQGGIAAALADFQNAFVIYRAAGEARGQAKALQNIAGIYQDAGDNRRALRFFAQAAETYRGDPAFALAAYNNVGESLRLLGRYRAAERQFDQALTAARELGSPLLQANVLTNIAATRLLRKDLSGATRFAMQALELTREREASDERPFVFGVMAQIAATRHDDTRAAALLDRTFADVDLAASPIAFREFHKLAAEVYARKAQPELALAHLRAWKRLDDSVRAVAASTNAALMAAQFDFSTQNVRIAQLQANRARLHETVLIIVVAAISVIAGLLLTGILSLRRSRNQIRGANRELTKALQAKSDFLAMTSHEIRTPLNGILGMTQVMLADRQLHEEGRQRIKLVHSAGETMRALVDDILDLSKMDSGHLSISRAPVQLPELITEAAALWREKAEAKGLAFTIDLSACPSGIEEDGDRLRQILFNLLSNAVKFTEAGSIRLAARTRGETLEIEVVDTGIGIAAEDHELIFEKFQQADVSTTRRFGGTGLGLAICRSLAAAMGGAVSVRSALAAGATFTLALPYRAIDAEPDTIDPAAPLAKKVVLLEPNALTQRMLAKAIRAATGDEPMVAPDAQAVLHAMGEGTVDRVVASHGAIASSLPAIVAAARSARAEIIVLGGADEVIAEELLHGVGSILRRPFTASEVGARVSTVTSGSPTAAAA